MASTYCDNSLYVANHITASFRLQVSCRKKAGVDGVTAPNEQDRYAHSVVVEDPSSRPRRRFLSNTDIGGPLPCRLTGNAHCRRWAGLSPPSEGAALACGILSSETADGVEMMRERDETADRHRFNADLLVNPGDLDIARVAFPRIFHVLDHAALRTALLRYDRPADAAKRRGRIAGLLAIGFGMIALFTAAASPSARWQGIVAALCGLISIAVGLGGALYAGAKRRWLLNRVVTERLRQYHFQAFVCHWRAIAASLVGGEGARAYTEAREIGLQRLMARYPGQLDSELTDLLEDETDAKCWLHQQQPLPAGDETLPDLDELFAAYRDLRIRHQLDYANYKLRSEQNPLAWSPRLQEIIFSYASLVCIIVIFAIHLSIAASLSWLGHAEQLSLLGLDIHVWVIWIAILVLGLRALQEGLQPEREIERYRHYRTGLRAVRDRFDKAQSTVEKFEIMQEMERLSFDEFRNFLRSSNEARFII
jgi:hypothetical protein